MNAMDTTTAPQGATGAREVTVPDGAKIGRAHV